LELFSTEIIFVLIYDLPYDLIGEHTGIKNGSWWIIYIIFGVFAMVKSLKTRDISVLYL